MFLVGVGLALMGLVITMGAVLTTAGAENLLGHLLLTIAFGVVPMALGGLLVFRALRRVTRIRREGQERRILDLARRRGGRLTVADVASSTALTLEEARQLLDDIHLSGHCATDLGEDGTMTYRFAELVVE